MRPPTWVSGWHAPLLKLMKAYMVPNRNDTRTLHRLVDDLFAQLQERLASGVDGPGAFRTLLTDVVDHFHRAPRGAALASLQKFGVPSGTPFLSLLRYFRVMVAGTVDMGGPLAPSPDMAMELVRIRAAQQYPTLMPTLFPGKLATQEKPYDSVAALWVAFAHLKPNTSPAIDCDAFSPANQGLSSLSHDVAASSVSPVTSPHRNMRRFGRQDAAHSVLNVSLTHSRRDPFAVDYGIWSFDDRDYDIVYTVTNNILNTDLSLWTPLLSEDARRQACVQYKGRCFNCGTTEHSLRWCPVPFKNIFSLLNPEFGPHDPDGSIFETWKLRMRRWRQQNASRGRQGNQRHSAQSNHRSRYTNNRGHNTAYQRNPPGTACTHVTADMRYLPQRARHAPQTPTMGRGPGTTSAPPANNHTPTIRATQSYPHDGSKTAHRPLRCIRHYTMDCSARPIVRSLLLVPVTPDSGDKSVYPKPPTLSLRMDLIRQARRQFRGVGRCTSKGLTSGISANPTPTITRKRYPSSGTLWHKY